MSDSLFTDSLFDDAANGAFQPLANRVRPQCLDEYVGQSHLLGLGKPLRQAIERGAPHSMILWGPPGVGKTTLAKLLAQTTDMHYESLTAVFAGVKDVRLAVERAKLERVQYQRQSLLFIDEIHRFNKAQQDAFLPYVEDGTFILVGATTENPSFELNNALLSRARVYVLQALQSDDLQRMLQQALNHPQAGYPDELQVDVSAREMLVAAADGDGRTLLNLLELCCDIACQQVDPVGHMTVDCSLVERVASSGVRRFDKQGEHFYDQISALHKSVRGSSVDGALYWLARMLDGGCDPLYIARRVVRMASEDIGNADPRGLEVALNAWQVQERLGSPEGELAIAQAVAYLAVAPKSNAVYSAFKRAQQLVREQPSADVPLHLRNAPTQLMKNLDYGADYRYAHDEPEAYAAGECYLPESIKDEQFYWPVERGLELKIGDKMQRLRQLDQQSLRQRFGSGGAATGMAEED